MMEVTNGMMPVIVATRREFVAVLDSYVFCNLCEKEVDAFEEMYYIPVIGSVYCEDCMKLYKKTAIKYRVDDKMAVLCFNKMVEKFKDLGVWYE